MRRRYGRLKVPIQLAYRVEAEHPVGMDFVRSRRLEIRKGLGQLLQLPERMNMNDTPIEPMSAENVEEFDVLIFESRDLLVSVIPRWAPWRLQTENYGISSE